MTHCTRMKRLLGWMLLLLISAVECSSNSPPGKPVLKQCHSPDKETFTCWWEPDADDGENTTYHLFYRKDQREYEECPDYRTAGKNSCFFDKAHTSIWQEYALFVEARNAFGNTSSDVSNIDVENIVKPNPPENVTLQLEFDKNSPIIHVTWNRFSGQNLGWVTPKYQLRLKKEDTDWTDVLDAGTQSHFSIYSATPGKQYTVQVRCALDNGFWSEWSNATYLKIPKHETKQLLWIIISLFSGISSFTALCILFNKRKFIKQCLLPPIPGPKIKGVNVQLLKNGRSEEVTSAMLIHQVFPQMTPWKNHVEEYLVVSDIDMLLVKDLKSRNGMVILNEFSNEANENKEELIVQNNNVQTLDYFVDTSESKSDNELNNVNTMETERAHLINDLKVMPLENSSYVDVQKQEPTLQGVDMSFMDYSTVSDIKGEHTIIVERQNSSSNSKITDMNREGEEYLPEDYTRVKEVKSDHMVLLQDPSRMEYTDCGKHNSPHPVMDKGGVYAKFLRNGYVDNISTPLY